MKQNQHKKSFSTKPSLAADLWPQLIFLALYFKNVFLNTLKDPWKDHFTI